MVKLRRGAVLYPFLSLSILYARVVWKTVGPGGGSDLLCSAVHPTNPDVIYIAGDIEGIYKTADGGASWHLINNNLARGPWTQDVYRIQQIKIDPNDPSYKTLYICTPIGLFRTTDDGEKWTLVFPDTFYSEVDFVAVYSVAIDPEDGNTIFLGTQGRGAYRTTDGGLNWDSLNVGMPDTAIVYGIYIDPTSQLGNRTIYLGTSDGVYKSTDNGNSWSPQNTGLPHNYVWNLRGVVSGGSSILYLTLLTQGIPGNPSSFKGGIYKSTNGAASWTDITGDLPKYQATDSLFYFYQKFVVNPLNTDVIYIGTIMGFPDEELGAWEEWGIYKTYNGGISWKKIDTVLTFGWMDTTFYNERHALVLDMSPADTNIIYWGRDWMSKSTDAGRTWQQIYTSQVGSAWRGNGLEMMMTEGMAFDLSNSDIVYVGYDDMGPFRSNDGGISFMPLDTIQDPYDGYDAAKDIIVDPDNGDHIYLSRYEGMGFAQEYGFSMGQVWRSTDGGTTWQKASAGLPDGRPDLAIDPKNGSPGSRTLYCASYNNGVYKTTNSGGSWSPVNNGLGEDAAYAWEISINPSNPEEIYLGLNSMGKGGGLYKSTDGGSSWTKLTNFPPYDVLSIKFDTLNNYVYVGATDNYDWSFNGGLYRSDDGGNSWTKILSQPRVSDVEILQSSPDTIFAVSQPWYSVWIDSLNPGVYRSFDGGTSWSNITGNLQHTFITFIKLNPNDLSELYAGTGGGGLWVSNNAVGMEENTINKGTKHNLLKNFPNPFSRSTLIRYTLSQTGFVRIDIYNVAGQRVRRLVGEKKTPETYTIRWDGKDERGRLLPQGLYYCNLMVENHIVETEKMLILR